MREPLTSHPVSRRPRRANPALFWIVPAALLLAGVATWFLLVRSPDRSAPEPPAAAAPAPEPEPAPNPEPLAEEAPRPDAVEASAQTPPPPPPPPPEIPLPSLDESDAVLAGALREWFGADTVEQHVRTEHFIRNLVVTIDNLPRPKVALDKRPLQPTPGVFATRGEDDDLTIATENYARYTPFVAAVAKANPRIVVGLYRGYYPLLQEAYEELGNPEPSFNTRLVEVIDHLLATPEIDGPIRLAQPNVLYEFADERLESLSAGQKVLIRMGPAHAATIKRKLREIRAELASAPPALTGGGAEASSERDASSEAAPAR